MCREYSSQLLDGLLCCYLLHYFYLEWASTITKYMCPMKGSASQDVNVPMVELAIPMDEEVL